MELARDAGVIVDGQIVSQKVVKEDPPNSNVALTYTISRFRVKRSLTGEEIGATGAQLQTLKPGALVDVKQLGEITMTEVPAPLLEPAAEYLLFLVNAGEPAPTAVPAYYVVGVSAGIYSVAADVSSVRSPSSAIPGRVKYGRVSTTDGDTLPSELSLNSTKLPNSTAS